MKIKTIDRFDNPYDLMECYVPDLLGNLTDDEREELRHACDYESIELYVVNDKTVLTVDTVSDDVIGEDTLRSFVMESMKWARGRVNRRRHEIGGKTHERH